MFKNIKDQYIKNVNYSSVFATEGENQLDEEQLIKQLIEKKQVELQERRSQITSTQGQNANESSSAMQGQNMVSMRHSTSQALEANSSSMQFEKSFKGDHQEQMSSSNYNDQMRSSNNEGTQIRTQTTDNWAKQSEFLKLTSQCQNKEKINFAI